MDHPLQIFATLFLTQLTSNRLLILRERRTREKLARSTKWQTVTNGHKWPQMVANDPERSQMISNNHKPAEMIGNDRNWSQAVANVHKRLQIVTSGRKCSKFPNVLSILNVSNVIYVSNAPNVLNVSNVPKVSDVLNVSNVPNGPYVVKSRKSRCPNFTVTLKVTVVSS